MRSLLTSSLSLLVLALAASAHGQELRAPAEVNAGTGFSIAASGSGSATLYLIGPTLVSKRTVSLGADIAVQGNEVEQAGRYTAVLCSSQCTAAHFYVRPLQAARLRLLVHPSRVRVGQTNAISAVAFVFDKYRNIVLSPSSIKFFVHPKNGREVSASRATENGRAWVELTSARNEGTTKIGASVGNISEVRVVQQVASEACNLRIKANWSSKALWVETDPVRDCIGNPVPDGTVVSFTKVDSSGKTTVDVPVKRGIAKVEMPVSGNARITVASGAVTGNELELAGGAR